MQSFFTDFIALLQSSPALFYFYISLVSLAVGSFLNVVIYRVPLMMQRQWREECRMLLEIPDKTLEEQALPPTFNLMWPLSHCTTCKHKIAPWDNIPLLSYLWLRGRCRHCQVKISFRYFFIELLTLLLSLAVAYRFGISLAVICALLVTWILIAVSFIDLDELMIPDEMVYSLLWLGLFFSLFNHFTTPADAIIGALCGYLSLWTIATIFKLIMRKDGMGHGDFKLTAALGAWLGWQALPLIILAGSVAGVIIGCFLILFKGHQRQQPIPFGPFLALAGWIMMMLGVHSGVMEWLAIMNYP